MTTESKVLEYKKILNLNVFALSRPEENFGMNKKDIFLKNVLAHRLAESEVDATRVGTSGASASRSESLGESKLRIRDAENVAGKLGALLKEIDSYMLKNQSLTFPETGSDPFGSFQNSAGAKQPGTTALNAQTTLSREDSRYVFDPLYAQKKSSGYEATAEGLTISSPGQGPVKGGKVPTVTVETRDRFGTPQKINVNINLKDTGHAGAKVPGGASKESIEQSLGFQDFDLKSSNWGRGGAAAVDTRFSQAQILQSQQALLPQSFGNSTANLRSPVSANPAPNGLFDPSNPTMPNPPFEPTRPGVEAQRSDAQRSEAPRFDAQKFETQRSDAQRPEAPPSRSASFAAPQSLFSAIKFAYAPYSDTQAGKNYRQSVSLASGQPQGAQTGSLRNPSFSQTLNNRSGSFSKKDPFNETQDTSFGFGDNANLSRQPSFSRTTPVGQSNRYIPEGQAFPPSRSPSINRGAQNPSFDQRDQTTDPRSPSFGQTNENLARQPSFNKGKGPEPARQPSFSQGGYTEASRSPSFIKGAGNDPSRQPSFSQGGNYDLARQPSFNLAGNNPDQTRNPSFSQGGYHEPSRSASFSQAGNALDQTRNPSFYQGAYNGNLARNPSFNQTGNTADQTRNPSFNQGGYTEPSRNQSFNQGVNSDPTRNPSFNQGGGSISDQTRNPSFNQGANSDPTRNPSFNQTGSISDQTQNPSFNQTGSISDQTRNPSFNQGGYNEASRNPSFNQGANSDPARNQSFNQGANSDPARNPSFNQGGYNDPSRNPSFNQGSNDPARNPSFNQGAMSSENYRNPSFNQGGYTDSARNPSFSQGATDPSRKLSFNQAATDPTRNPSFNQSSSGSSRNPSLNRGTADPSRNPSFSQEGPGPYYLDPSRLSLHDPNPQTRQSKSGSFSQPRPSTKDPSMLPTASLWPSGQRPSTQGGDPYVMADPRGSNTSDDAAAAYGEDYIEQAYRDAMGEAAWRPSIKARGSVSWPEEAGRPSTSRRSSAMPVDAPGYLQDSRYSQRFSKTLPAGGRFSATGPFSRLSGVSGSAEDPSVRSPDTPLDFTYTRNSVGGEKKISFGSTAAANTPTARIVVPALQIRRVENRGRKTTFKLDLDGRVARPSTAGGAPLDPSKVDFSAAEEVFEENFDLAKPEDRRSFLDLADAKNLQNEQQIRDQILAALPVSRKSTRPSKSVGFRPSTTADVDPRRSTAGAKDPRRSELDPRKSSTVGEKDIRRSELDPRKSTTVGEKDIRRSELDPRKSTAGGDPRQSATGLSAQSTDITGDRLRLVPYDEMIKIIARFLRQNRLDQQVEAVVLDRDNSTFSVTLSSDAPAARGFDASVPRKFRVVALDVPGAPDPSSLARRNSRDDPTPNRLVTLPLPGGSEETRFYVESLEAPPAEAETYVLDNRRHLSIAAPRRSSAAQPPSLTPRAPGEPTEVIEVALAGPGRGKSFALLNFRVPTRGDSTPRAPQTIPVARLESKRPSSALPSDSRPQTVSITPPSDGGRSKVLVPIIRDKPFYHELCKRPNEPGSTKELSRAELLKAKRDKIRSLPRVKQNYYEKNPAYFLEVSRRLEAGNSSSSNMYNTSTPTRPVRVSTLSSRGVEVPRSLPPAKERSSQNRAEGVQTSFKNLEFTKLVRPITPVRREVVNSTRAGLSANEFCKFCDNYFHERCFDDYFKAKK